MLCATAPHYPSNQETYMNYPFPMFSLEEYKKWEEYIKSKEKKEEKKVDRLTFTEHLIWITGLLSLFWLSATCIILSYSQAFIHAAPH
jgi:hypothetical protein